MTYLQHLHAFPVWHLEVLDSAGVTLEKLQAFVQLHLMDLENVLDVQQAYDLSCLPDSEMQRTKVSPDQILQGPRHESFFKDATRNALNLEAGEPVFF